MRPDERQALHVVALTVALGATFGVQAVVPDLGPLYLAPVLAAAIWFGRRAAIAVAVVAPALLTGAALLSPELPPTVLLGSGPSRSWSASARSRKRSLPPIRPICRCSR